MNRLVIGASGALRRVIAALGLSIPFASQAVGSVRDRALKCRWSHDDIVRIGAAQAKRDRKNARRAALAAKGQTQ